MISDSHQTDVISMESSRDVARLEATPKLKGRSISCV